jgi:hypothetical protein
VNIGIGQWNATAAEKTEKADTKKGAQRPPKYASNNAPAKIALQITSQ